MTHEQALIVISAYLSDFVNSLPISCRQAIGSHANEAVRSLKEQYEKKANQP